MLQARVHRLQPCQPPWVLRVELAVLQALLCHLGVTTTHVLWLVHLTFQ